MSGRYQKYPEYKESGIRFFNDIPKHWNINKVRFISSFGRGLSITRENLKDKGIPCVSYGEVHSKFGFEVDPSNHNLKCVDEEYLKMSPYALLSKGDFVFADTSEDIDGSGNFTQLVSDETLFAGYHTVVVRPTSDNYYRFLAYVFDSPEYRTQVRGAVKGVKVFSVTQAILKNTNVWLPTYDEQQKIANFLDHETAKIDTLIAKQEKLIALLKEKRQAVISHAVTRGLPNKEQPNVPMKDSGVEWLGEVPKHWQMKPLKCLCSFSGGGTPPKDKLEYWNGDIPWVSPKDMKSFWIENSIDKVTNLGVEQSSTKIVKTGSLLMVVRSGILQHSIPIGITKKEVTLNQDMKALDFNKLMSAIYFSYFVRSNQTNLLLVWGKDGATVESIEQEYLASFSIPVPPMSEQHDICNNLDKIMARFDKLTEKSLIQIELLKERKTALISAAVTGKIDVRHFALKEEVNHG